MREKRRTKGKSNQTAGKIQTFSEREGGRERQREGGREGRDMPSNF